MLPKDCGAEGLRRNDSGSCKTACHPHQWLPQAATLRRFFAYRSRRPRRVAHRAVGHGYAAGW